MLKVHQGSGEPENGLIFIIIDTFSLKGKYCSYCVVMSHLLTCSSHCLVNPTRSRKRTTILTVLSTFLPPLPFTPTGDHREIMQRKKVGLCITDILTGAVSSLLGDREEGKATNRSVDGLLVNWTIIPEGNGQIVTPTFIPSSNALVVLCGEGQRKPSHASLVENCPHGNQMPGQWIFPLSHHSTSLTLISLRQY